MGRVGQEVKHDSCGEKLQCLFSLREKLVKTLVELLTNQVGEKMVVVLALRLLYLLMTKHEWRPLFAREGGIYAVLVCMQEYKTSVLVQQAGLAVSGTGPGRSKRWARWAVWETANLEEVLWRFRLKRRPQHGKMQMDLRVPAGQSWSLSACSEKRRMMFLKMTPGLKLSRRVDEVAIY